MKNIILRKYATVLVLAVSAIVFMPTACTKEPPKEPEITMTTQASKVEIWVGITLSKGSDNFSIDWGDGEISNSDNFSYRSSNPNLDRDSYKFSHSYLGASKKCITITGDNIYMLYCCSNQLSVLDVSQYDDLRALFCSQNLLTSLVLNPKLRELWCEYNPLTTFDVSNCTALERLFAINCSLTSLKVSSNNTALINISCGDNKLSADALNNLFRSLPDTRGWISVKGNPGENDCDYSILEGKGWGQWFPGQRSTEDCEELYF